MDQVFPFGFPFPTAWYLTLYVVTLTVHVVFMNYVLAGSGYLAIASLIGVFSRKTYSIPDAKSASPLFALVRDWLPFALSAAITAGVAPLLFLQILYQENFYTANLLLSHRWMAILPVLIMAFYLLYLMKTNVLREKRHRVLRFGTALLIFLCFAFTAWSWTENHLLSMDHRVWSSFYGEERWRYDSPALLPRLLLWAFGSIPMFCAWLGIQLHMKRKSRDGEYEGSAIAKSFTVLARLAIAGMIITVAVGLWYWLVAREEVEAAMWGVSGAYYSCAAVAMMGVEAAIWIRVLRNGRSRMEVSGRMVWALFVLAVLVILLMSIVRELIRLQSIDIENLYAIHEKASEVGGFGVFLLFAILNIGVILLCMHLARKAIRRGTDEVGVLRD